MKMKHLLEEIQAKKTKNGKNHKRRQVLINDVENPCAPATITEILKESNVFASENQRIIQFGMRFVPDPNNYSPV